jgi:phosphoribosylformimino-5-aminoimidazole carboxamide ribotide isomerase
VEALLATGIERVIIGTRALEDFGWFSALARQFAGRVVLGLDAREGKVATHGWLRTSEVTDRELAGRVNDLPLAAIVYTDIARDGMLAGPNVEATARLAAACRIPVIASGGVGELAHIEQLARLPLAGIIVGRALYERKFTLAQALAAAGQMG